MDVFLRGLASRAGLKPICCGILTILMATLAGCAERDHHLGKNLTKSKYNPQMSSWQPNGFRFASRTELDHPILPANNHYYSLHAGIRASDEVNHVFAPVFESLWNAQSNALVTESPVFDKHGDAYFTPAFPTGPEQAMLIKLDGETGQRQWAIGAADVGAARHLGQSGASLTIAANTGQGGSPLVLNDPASGDSVIYAASYSRAYAVNTAGEMLWSSNMDAPSRQLHAGEAPPVTHVFGVTYQPQLDAIIVTEFNGDLVAFDRQTGVRLGGFLMPGSPSGERKADEESAQSTDNYLSYNSLVWDLVRDVLVETFELQNFDPQSSGALLNAVLGQGAINANLIASDPNSTSLWVASTAEDGLDGIKDGVSELGALYRIDLARNAANNLDFRVSCVRTFPGGSASTPALSADGERVYVADNTGFAYAIDRECNIAWQLDVGETAVASLAVASEQGAEIYYPTRKNIYQIKENDQRNQARVIWKADLNSSFYSGNILNGLDGFKRAIRRFFERRLNIELPISAIKIGAANLDLASIGQNGIMVHSGFGFILNLEGRERVLPIAMNLGLYDRKNGEFINGTRALEENIGALYATPDGGIMMGSSPVRRAILRSIIKAPDFFIEASPALERFGDRLADILVPPLQGGVTKYGAREGFHYWLRDAVCHASYRIANSQHNQATELSAEADLTDADVLLSQAHNAVNEAERVKELTLAQARDYAQLISQTQTQLLNRTQFIDSQPLSTACEQLKAL